MAALDEVGGIVDDPASAPGTDAASSSSVASYRSALRNREFRLLIGRLSVSAVGSWAYNVGLVVFVFDSTGSAAWLSAIAAARFLPALVASPFGGVLAERFERRRVMMASDGAAMLAMAGLAVIAALDGPVWLALVLSAMTSVVCIVDEPAMGAMVPQVVGEEDLAAANGLKSAIDNLSVIVGPALGAGLLLVMPASGVFAVNAATFGVGLIFLSLLRARSTPTDVTDGGETGILRQTTVGFRAIVSDQKAFVLVLFSVLASFVYGTDIVLFALVGERMGLGADGFGYFLTGLGIGGVLAAGLVNRLASAPRLGLILVVGMAMYLLPTAVLTVTDSTWLAVSLQAVRGAGTLVVDVLAVTALQRTLAPELLSRVFGAFWSLVLLAIALGSLAVPPIIAATNLDTALFVMSFGLMGVVLLSAPLLRTVDAASVARVGELRPVVKVLASLGIFQSSPQAVLERLAAATRVVIAHEGDVIIREGDRAQAFYVLASGSLVVTARAGTPQSKHLRDLDAPAYVGEIGLLERVPRTATVTAGSNARLFRIEGDAFLEAVTSAHPSAAFVEATAARHASTRVSGR